MGDIAPEPKIVTDATQPSVPTTTVIGPGTTVITEAPTSAEVLEVIAADPALIADLPKTFPIDE